VNEGPGAYVTNFAFVPAYNNGSAPYGVWSATALATTSQWQTAGDFNYDVGFAVVGQVNGRYLSDVVGSQTIGFNQARGHFLYSFGYPQARPYDGTTLDYCSDAATNDTLGGTADQRLDCNMTGGSSGGPWFDGFSTTSGTGVQVSVNSFGYTGERNAMYGPYFGSVIQNTYNAVQSAA
jgi:V8-like Glu-specific endopeptidase